MERLPKRMRVMALAHALIGRWLEKQTGEKNPEFVLVAPNMLPDGSPTAVSVMEPRKTIELLRTTAARLERLEEHRQHQNTRLH